MTNSSIQQSLSRAQAIPVLGILVSPVKAIVSLTQAVGALVATIFLGLAAILHAFISSSNRAFFWRETGRAVGLLGEGLTGLVYSIANICSLGVVGQIMESNQNSY